MGPDHCVGTALLGTQIIITRGDGKMQDRRRRHAVRSLAVLCRHFDVACQQTGVSLPQYRVLLGVRQKRMRAAQLATHARVRRPTLTSLLEGLVKQGLIKRVSVEGDRRGIALEVTQEGLAALRAVEQRLGDVLDSTLERGDRETLLEAFEQFSVLVGREVEQTSS